MQAQSPPRLRLSPSLPNIHTSALADESFVQTDTRESVPQPRPARVSSLEMVSQPPLTSPLTPPLTPSSPSYPHRARLVMPTDAHSRSSSPSSHSSHWRTTSSSVSSFSAFDSPASSLPSVSHIKSFSSLKLLSHEQELADGSKSADSGAYNAPGPMQPRSTTEAAVAPLRPGPIDTSAELNVAAQRFLLVRSFPTHPKGITTH